MGFAFHLVNGLIFAFAYVLLFDAIDRSDWWIGASAGAIHGALALILLLPVLQENHPRKARANQGPDPTPMLQSPGFLALNYGRRTPIVTFVGHVINGAVVAAFYAPLG